MNIAKKLYISFSLLIVVAFSVSVYSVIQLVSMNEEYSTLIENRLQQIYMASDLQSRVGVQGVHLRQYVLTGKEDSLQGLVDEQQRIAENIEKLEATVVTEEMRGITDRLIVVKADFNKAAAKVVTQVDNLEKDRAIATLAGEVSNANLQLNDLADEMLAYHQRVFSEVSTKTNADVRTDSFVLLILTLIGVVVGIVSILIVRRSVIRPLRTLVGNVEQIAAGDLTGEQLVMEANDEVGTLARSVNEMKQSMHTLISAANDNARQLAMIARELNASTSQVAQTSTQISTNVETITAGTQVAAQIANDSAVAMDESASGVQNIAESTQTIHSDAITTRKLANEGEQSIVTAKEQMESIYNSSKLTNELIGNLSKSSAEIQHISKVIGEITDQTNLLALNAAIEAARAGEHGKGFAVVADEVRKLAEQSKESAQLIGNLTTDILTETTRVEQSVTEGLARVETGVDVINTAGSAFSSIVASVEGVTVRMAEVSAVTEEMSAGTEEVSASIETLATTIHEAADQTEAITQQIEEQTASIQEMNAIAMNLEVKAEELTAIIAKFKV